MDKFKQSAIRFIAEARKPFEGNSKSAQELLDIKGDLRLMNMELAIIRKRLDVAGIPDYDLRTYRDTGKFVEVKSTKKRGVRKSKAGL